MTMCICRFPVLFLSVLLIIVLDSECRKRKHKAKCKAIAAAGVAVEKPEITSKLAKGDQHFSHDFVYDT